MKRLLGRAASAAVSAKVLTEAGVVRPYPPSALVGIVRAVSRWGTGPAGGFTALAARSPDRIGLVDERGSLTFGDLHRRSNALAHALAERGIGAGDSVALMCRNHRGFVDATVAVAKLGADLLYLNTAFAGPQLVDVLEREQPGVIIHDEEFTGLLSAAEDADRVVAWTDHPSEGATTLESLVATYPVTDLGPPSRHSRIVILTSGTTGTPKGAPRSEAGLDAAVALLSRIPMRHGWHTHIAAPLFHTWGLAHLLLAMLLGSTVVLRRTFDPEAALRVVRDEGCQSLVVIPVMLQRILALPAETLDELGETPLRVVAASGSALSGDLALAWMDRFGDHLYNIYGSTEVAYASVAGPEDLREAPASAGRPPYGTIVKVYDEHGEEVAEGESGRIFVGNSLLFEGYTGGGRKDMIDGLMSTGDLGRFGLDGRLYVEGRDDDMIVSGGENVFPQEVEDCLARHDAVADVAVAGVDDVDYGARLRAFVVLAGPAAASEADLKGWVEDHLARYKVPREIVFLDELPRNATGKVLKRELVDRG